VTCFTFLQRSDFVEIRPVNRTDAEQHDRFQQRRLQRHVAASIEPSRILLEAIWDHRRVSVPKRAAFSEQHFSHTRKNVTVLQREVIRYLSVDSTQLSSLFRLISFRNTYVKNIARLCHSPLLRDSNARKTDAESLVVELYNSVLYLRHVTCGIIDIVYAKRAAEGSTAEPLEWEGKDYMLSMQTDLQEHLQHTHYQRLFLDEYPLQHNPFLLPYAMLQGFLSTCTTIDSPRQSMLRRTPSGTRPRGPTGSHRDLFFRAKAK